MNRSHSTVVAVKKNSVSSLFLPTMLRVKLLRKFFKLMVYTIVTAGFAHQSSFICDEYFKYPTVTSVSIVRALPRSNFPQVVLCTDLSYDANQYYLTQFTDLWENLVATAANRTPKCVGHPWGDPKIFSYDISRSRRMSCSSTDYSRSCPPIDDLFELKKFLLQSKTCFVIRTRRPLDMAPDELLRNPSFHMIHVGINVKQPIYGVPSYNTRGRIVYYTYMTSYESENDISLHIPLRPYAFKEWKNFMLDLSYSQKVTILSPPPYDTNCRDYRRDGLTSQGYCVKICLNEWTVSKYGKFFSDHVLLVDNLQEIMTKHSQLTPMHPDIKDKDMTAEFIHQASDQYFNNSRKDWAEDWKRMAGIFDDIRKRITSCRQSCSQSDCEMEHIIPFQVSNDRANNPQPFTTMDIKIYPPREPVVLVRSKAKLNLLDFAVYLLSSLSFWFGFCPLSLGDRVGKSRDNKRQSRRRSQNRRIRSPESQIRSSGQKSRCFNFNVITVTG